MNNEIDEPKTQKKYMKIFWNPFILIGLIIIAGFFIRLNFLTELPLTYDSLKYFIYAMDLVETKNFPSIRLELGWPVLLSIFFSLIKLENIIDYMYMQKLISIIISSVTIIPVYLASKRFFDKSIALCCASLFAFQPHIIQNSLLGITEPLFILIGICAFYLFLSNKIKSIYFSFILVSLFTIVRTQGIILFLGLSILYIIKFRKNKKYLIQYTALLSIFIILLIPIMSLWEQDIGYNPLIASSTAPIKQIMESELSVENSQTKSYITGIETLVIQIAKSMIPYFIFFVPLGTVFLFRNIDNKKLSIIIIMTLGLIVAAYIAIWIKDIRYIFWLFPYYAIISGYTIKFYSDKIKMKNVFFLILVSGVCVSSLIFLNYTDIRENQYEAFTVAEKIKNENMSINRYTDVAEYIQSFAILDNPKLTLDNYKNQTLYPKVIPILKLSTVEEYIEQSRNKGITHFVLDGKNLRLTELNNVFDNSKKYPYLKMIYDSHEDGMKYHVKIFEIDYSTYDQIKNND